MDVPATRPEVTTTGIYGEELNGVRHCLLRSDVAWCGDLTARTQVLIVGRSTPTGSRKLAVARARRLPCVSPSWATRGGCAFDAVPRFDVCHELAEVEVCTTSLSHLERQQVQTVCSARGATYNAMLTRQCGLLVASASALAFTSPSTASPTTANDKIRFARRHGTRTMPLEEFVLRYDVEPSGKAAAEARCAYSARVSGVDGWGEQRHVPMLRAALDRTGASNTLGGSSSSGPERHDGRAQLGCTHELQRESLSAVTGADVFAPASVRCTAMMTGCSASSTPRPSSALAHAGVASMPTAAVEAGEAWRLSGGGVALSAVLPSQMPSPSPRALVDEFSDVVAYCSPPQHLTMEQHDLLAGMGVTVRPQLTPSTTHVLLLSSTAAAADCFFPRPGLQVVSWQWIAQCQLEQRRLSCAGFRVPVEFCPVVTFTGLTASDKHELAAALRHSQLACEVQDALVLGRANAGTSLGSRPGGDGRSCGVGTALSPSYLPRATTHLVALRRQLLASQKVAVLAQHCHQHVRRRTSSLPSSCAAPPPPCRLVGVEWVYRSIQHGQWLDPELFALSLPHPEAFAMATAVQLSAEARAAPRGGRGGSLTSVASTHGAQVPLQQQQQRAPMGPGVVTAVATAVVQPVVSVTVGDDDDDEEERGAAHSQHASGNTGDPSQRVQGGSVLSPHTSPPPPASVSQHLPHHHHNCSMGDEDDEEAGGESPAATAALRSALQVLRTSQPPVAQLSPSALPPQTERHASTASSPSSSSSPSTSASPGKHASGGASQLETASAPPPLHAAPSHTFLATQYSPTLENLLGELEAYPSDLLGGGPPFAALALPPPHPPPPPPPPPSSSASLAGQVGNAPSALDAESFLCTPPSSSTGANAQQAAVLPPSSLLRPLRLRRQSSSAEVSVAAGRHLSDESQVIFYHLGLNGGDGSGAEHAPMLQDNGAEGTSPSRVDRDNNDNDNDDRDVAVVGSSTRNNSSACLSGAVARGNGLGGVTAPRSRPSATAAVFLITGDVIRGGLFDWDVFSSRFPHCQRTTKPEECTHFVTGFPNKTEQFLCCVAAGLWILTPPYLSACVAAGCLVAEEPFEWTPEMAGVLGQRDSVASLVRGCRLQRQAATLPFTKLRVQVCCTTAARAESFLRVLRNGGCTTMQAVSASEVLAGAVPPQVGEEACTEAVVLADETTFTEAELEAYAQGAAAARLGPIMRLSHLVHRLCGTEADEDLLSCFQARKRSRTESPSAR